MTQGTKSTRAPRTDPSTGAAFKGSQRWLQRFVAERPGHLQPEGLPTLTWVSPVSGDRYREYGDGAFLKRLGLDDSHCSALREFWPAGGPHWDGLARFDGGVVLVEAKAHVREFLSSGSKASHDSMARISSRLDECRKALGVEEISNWAQVLYQYTNRLTHLWWLRKQGVNAKLLLVGFLGDDAVGGPKSSDVWDAAYLVADHALGLPRGGHALSCHILHVHPEIKDLTQ